jgi:hypothetical protein
VGAGGGFTAKVLRVRAGQRLRSRPEGSPRHGRDVDRRARAARDAGESNVDRVELLPAAPVPILEGEQAYRLVA